MIRVNDVREFPLQEAIRELRGGFHVDEREFFGAPGDQHYRLLASLAAKFNGVTILDIGTHMGSSALALATNPANRIVSFDIQRKTPLRDLPNVSFELADLWDPLVRAYWEPTILGSAMIVLDVDPHNGTMEWEFYQWLKEKQYKGLLVCDDIWYFKPMRDQFWLKVPSSEKLDVTNLGHWSGTGLIAFAPQPFEFETLIGTRQIGRSNWSTKSPWTVVTAYFDLTRMPDASEEIKKRPRSHYLHHARATLALDQPLVVFCEPDAVEEIRAMRPTHLQDTLRIEAVNFEDLPLSKYRERILENRRTHPYAFDSRNTASYYLLCMARYALVKRVIQENPFSSTHFAWLNICIERMGYKNVQHLEEVFCGPPRDKVSTCYIDYISKKLIDDVPTYFQHGRCSMCSGFFTGRKDTFTEFCNRVEAKFLKFLEQGYGHADEQLFSPVYFDAPDIFEPYFGDYQTMITTYRHMYEKVNMPLHYVIPKALAAGDLRTVRTACKFVWASVQAKACELSPEELEGLLTAWVTTLRDQEELPAELAARSNQSM